MKKVLSMILCLTLLLSVCVLHAAATENADICRERFYQQYGQNGTILDYEELYVHHDEAGEAQWVFLRACDNMVMPVMVNCVVGNQLYVQNAAMHPFTLGFGVYDIAEDCFYEIGGVNGGMNNLKRYPEAVALMNTYGKGYLLGDVDYNGVVNIDDATLLQMRVAGLTVDNDQVGATDEILECIYDVNQDGDCTIVDATAIQKIVAEITDEA